MKKKWIASQAYGLLTSFLAENSRMKKRCFAALAAMVLAGSAFAAKFPSYLMVDGTTVTGVKNQKKLPANLVIPDGVTEIGDRAFSNCTSLTSVTIPDSVTTIGYRAFGGCTSLASVVIPGSVMKIGGGAFSGCSLLASVMIADSVTEIGNGAFEGCTSLASVSIPASVTYIGGGAFSGCSLLASVMITDSVTEIGNGAFEGCTSLVSVTIPGSVTTIGESAFYGCTSLASVTIPGSARAIGYRAFDGCMSLTEIQFKGTTAQWQAIQGSGQIQGSVVRCSDGHIGIEEVPEYLKITGTTVTGYTGTVSANLVIPDGVTAIGERAFNYCTSLVSVSIPDSVTQIGNYAFTGCTSLTEIQFKGTTAQWRAIRGRAIQGSSEAKKVATIRCSDGSLSAEDFPEYLKISGTTVTGYTDTLPANLVIPDGVTVIGSFAFRGCTSFVSMTIPDSVWEIGNFAFEGCTSLKEIQFGGTIAQWKAVKRNYEIKIPSIRCTDGYIGVKEVPDYLKMSGTAVMGYTDKVPANLVIPDGVTSVGGSAFYNCKNLVSVEISNGVTEIGWDAFNGCTSLVSVTIPDGVTVIGERAFSGCTFVTAHAKWEKVAFSLGI